MKNYFSSNLNFLRKKLGLNQTELASSLGLKRNTLSNYETGHSEPNFETLKIIAHFFDKNVDEILFQDLSQVDLIQNPNFKKNYKKVDRNVDRKVDLIPKKYPQFEGTVQANEPCSACIYKDQIILHKDKLIEALQGQINALNSLVAKLSADTAPQKKQAS